jgi:hypothetical protein
VLNAVAFKKAAAFIRRARSQRAVKDGIGMIDEFIHSHLDRSKCIKRNDNQEIFEKDKRRYVVAVVSEIIIRFSELHANPNL